MGQNFHFMFYGQKMPPSRGFFSFCESLCFKEAFTKKSSNFVIIQARCFKFWLQVDFLMGPTFHFRCHEQKMPSSCFPKKSIWKNKVHTFYFSTLICEWTNQWARSQLKTECKDAQPNGLDIGVCLQCVLVNMVFT